MLSGQVSIILIVMLSSFCAGTLSVLIAQKIQKMRNRVIDFSYRGVSVNCASFTDEVQKRKVG